MSCWPKRLDKWCCQSTFLAFLHHTHVWIWHLHVRPSVLINTPGLMVKCQNVRDPLSLRCAAQKAPATACHSTFRGLSGLMRQALKACQRLNVKNITPSPSENFAALPVEPAMGNVKKKTLKDTQLRENSSQNCWWAVDFTERRTKREYFTLRCIFKITDWEE